MEKKQTAMIPKEKAKELYCKYTDALNIRDLQTTANPFAKNCSLIAVDEIYKLRLTHGQYLDYDVDKINYYSYWEEVKQEIEKL